MFKHHKYEMLGILAAILNLVAFYNLIHHNFMVEDTNSLSWGWLFMGIINQILWVIFGFANQILPTMLVAPLLLLGFISLLFLKIKLEIGYTFTNFF